jgi:hypothetical protein
MRRMAYIIILAALFCAGMGLVVLWLNNWLLYSDHRLPMLLVGAASIAATATVALAEEVAASFRPPIPAGARGRFSPPHKEHLKNRRPGPCNEINLLEYR